MHPVRHGNRVAHPKITWTGTERGQESPSKCFAVVWIGAIGARSWGGQLTDSVLFCCVCKGDSNDFRTDTEEPRVPGSRTVTTTCRVMDEVLGEHSGYPETEMLAFAASAHSGVRGYPFTWLGQ